MQKIKGFTLLQLLVSLAILTSLTAIAVPNLTSFTIKLRVDTELRAVQRLLLQARNHAINYQTYVTLCPLENNRCISDWQTELTVFIDHNKDKSLNTVNDKVIFTKPKIQTLDKLQYGRFRNAIIFGPTGKIAAWGGNGTFKYCPYLAQPLSRALIVSVTGKGYLTQDVDNDGIDENRRGQEITCR